MLNLITSALRNKVIWYLFSRYATFALQFVTSIYIAVKLGGYYFGVWSFFLLLVNNFKNMHGCQKYKVAAKNLNLIWI